MKKRGGKRREILRPSPNEAANIIQSEKEKRKRIRLKQIREQEKAFSRKVLEDARRRKNTELKHLTNHLKSQWEKEHNEKQLDLERKYHENLAEVGLGHKTASEDQTDYTKRELTEDEKQRASERYRKAVEQLMYERAKSSQSERKRAEARQQALEIERQRAAKIAALPPQLDPLGDISLGKDLKTCKQKKVDMSYQTSRFHLRPSVHVERDLDPNQEDARQAAKDEEQRLQDVMEDVQRDKAEQTEKARLRHKHALAQLQLEEDHKKLMEELGQLERGDRQRRQDAVAKIPVRIFQPPHKRLEDAEDRQRHLEQEFEDMYMMQTGYMGDLAVALEPPEHLRLASDDSLQSESDKGSSEPERDRESSQRTPTAAGPIRSSEREKHGSEQGEEPEEVTIDRAPKAPSEDPLWRLLQRIERQRDQWRKRQPTEEEGQPPAGETTGIPLPLPSTVPPSSKQEYRVPDSIPFSASPESLAEAELSDEEAEDRSHEVPGVADRPRLDNRRTPGVPEHGVDLPLPAVSSSRTLLHPLEAAQRSRTTTPAPTAQLTKQEALLEQEKLKLKLQQQTLRQQQLEQKLQDYQRQLADIYGPVEKIGAFERGSLEEHSSGEALYEGASSLAETTLEPFQEPGSVGAQSDTIQPGAVPSPLSQEGSPFTSEGLESSTLGSVTSDSTETEFPSEFRRTLAAAQATVDKAAELRQRERHVLEELSKVAEALPFNSRTQIGRDSASGSTSSLQSQDLVNISTPSTLSLSVTMPSELSVTAVTSHTSHMRPVPNFFEHRPMLTTQSQPPSSIVSDIMSVTAATSLLPKPSQQVQLSEPWSSVPQSFPVFSTGSEQVTIPNTGTIAESFGGDYSAPYSYSGSALAGAFGVPQSSTIQQSSLDYSSVSNSYVTVARPLRSTYAFTPSSRKVGIPKPSFLQQSSPSYSPGYLDYYQQKMEEERQLFEEQRNRIHRYSDLFKRSPQEEKGAQTYLPSGSIRKTVSPVEPHVKRTSYLPDVHGSLPTYSASNVGGLGLDANKENQGSIANSTGIRGDDRLRDISKRLGEFEKSLITSVSSTTVTSLGFGSKPLSTSEWSYSSSKTDYMLLPQEMAGLGSLGSAGSTLSSLSELTEMMTRLTSTSDESEEKSLKNGATGNQLASYVPEKTTKTGLSLSVGQSLLTVSQGDIVSNGPAREPVYAPSSVRPIDVTHSYTLTSTGTRLSTVKEPTLNIPSTRWTRGSDGKEWFVLSQSRTLSSASGLLGKESLDLPEDGEDAVFADARGERSHVSGSGDSGSSSEVHGLAPSVSSSASGESHGGSSQTSDLRANFSDESNSGQSEEVLENKPL